MYNSRDKELIERANATNLYDFLIRQGETLESLSNEWIWEHDKEKINISKNKWFSFYQQSGGYPIKLIQTYFDMDFSEAIFFLTGEKLSFTKDFATNFDVIHQNYVNEMKNPKEKKKVFLLPKANSNMERSIAYLTKRRFLDKAILQEFIKRKIIYESIMHNVVFVGYDENNIARHAHQKGTGSNDSFRGNIKGCMPEYSFRYIGTDDTLFVFEAPIDLLSYISLHQDHWQRHSYIALCGVSSKPVIHFLKHNPQINKVKIGLDHDAKGIEGSYRLKDDIRGLGYDGEVYRVISKYKDFNEDLKAMNGIEPIPAEEHFKIAFIKYACSAMPSLNAHITLNDLIYIHNYLLTLTDIESIAAISCECAEIAFGLAGKTEHNKERLTKMILNSYQPYKDNTGIKAKMNQLKSIDVKQEDYTDLCLIYLRIQAAAKMELKRDVPCIHVLNDIKSHVLC